jgi:hypothetical protein
VGELAIAQNAGYSSNRLCFQHDTRNRDCGKVFIIAHLRLQYICLQQLQLRGVLAETPRISQMPDCRYIVKLWTYISDARTEYNCNHLFFKGYFTRQ